MRITAFLTREQVLKEGLRHLDIETWNKCIDSQIEEFSSHFGPAPESLGSQWFDLLTNELLDDKEKSIHGFHGFLRSHYFMWNYPKNARVFASRFNISSRRARGKYVWDWIGKIACLHILKIVWTDDLDDPATASFIGVLDGTDFRCFEKKHPHLNQDSKQMSKKFHHGALKYEIMMKLFEAKIVWINGPHRGGKHDITMLREGGLKAKVKKWKKVICDSGYESSRVDEQFLSTPNSFDSKELAKFKSRARLRLETFNGRLKKWNILTETFRHRQEKHKLAFEAICVTLQYEMDHGKIVFDV